LSLKNGDAVKWLTLTEIFLGQFRENLFRLSFERAPRKLDGWCIRLRATYDARHSANRGGLHSAWESS